MRIARAIRAIRNGFQIGRPLWYESVFCHSESVAEPCMMADQPTSPPRKKLYIETVGCQMNLLDSELVVAKLRNEGYELTDDINQADAILYNTCSVRQHAEDKIYSALGRIKRLKERKPELTIGVLGCMAQKDQERSSGARRMSTSSSGPGQLAKVPELLAKAASTRTHADRREPGPERRLARGRHGELRELRRRPRAGDAAQPVPGVRPGHDGLRQVLHLLHRPLGPRARAEPPAGGDPGRGPAARRPGGQGDHPPGPDRQQLQVPGARRPALPALRPARADSRHRRHRADQVHHQFPQRHDRRPAPGRPRPAQGLPVPPRARAERLRRRSSSG